MIELFNDPALAGLHVAVGNRISYLNPEDRRFVAMILNTGSRVTNGFGNTPEEAIRNLIKNVEEGNRG